MVRRLTGRYRDSVLPSVPRCLLASLVLASLPGGGGGALRAQEACGSRQLQLEEVRARALPRNHGLDGWVAGSNGRIAFRAADGSLLVADAAAAPTTIPAEPGLFPVGLAFTGDTLLLVGTDGRAWIAGAPMASAGQAVLVPGGEALESAVRLAGRWYGLFFDAAAGLARVRDAGGRSLHVTASRTAEGQVRRFHLAAGAGNLLLGEVGAPFGLVRIDPATAVADSFATALVVAGAPVLPGDSLAHWRAMPPVALDCATLLTLTDLTGDRRVLIRYDAAGRVARAQLLTLPLGLLARIPDQPVLLGARRAGELELVWYAWHWLPDTPDSP